MTKAAVINIPALNPEGFMISGKRKFSAILRVDCNDDPASANGPQTRKLTTGITAHDKRKEVISSLAFHSALHNPLNAPKAPAQTNPAAAAIIPAGIP